ncbi:MAG: hypothetical protein NT051_03755 [Candidatus Micrarchaeota archaeon]|nr:hypothetical protein [Candidatus Micrarchaeota archaeon]
MMKNKFKVRVPDNANYDGAVMVETRMMKLQKRMRLVGAEIASRRHFARIRSGHELSLA